MNDLANLLAQTAVFSKLAPSDCANLANLACPRRLDHGEFLCHQGDVWPHFAYLVSGEMRWVLLSASGKEYVITDLKPPRVFWGHSFFDDQPMPACLHATQPASVYLWSRETALPILIHNPEGLWQVTKELVRMMRRSREIIYGLVFQPAAGRLANLLLNQFPRQEIPCIERTITLGEMAVRIACSPEAVSRLLHQFESAGILEITRASITLNNRAALEQLADSID